MTDRPVATHVVGIEIDDAVLKGVVLSFAQNKPILDGSYTVELQSKETDSVKQLYIPELDGNFQKHINRDLVISGVGTDVVLIRSMDSKLKKISDIDSTLSFQVEPLLPFAIEEAVIDRVIVKPTDDGTQLTLFVIKKENLKTHIDSWNDLNIDPEVIENVPNALAQFCKLFCSEESSHFVVNLGMNQITFALVKNGKLLSAQACRLGVKNLLNAFQQDNLVYPQGTDFFDLDFSNLNPTEQPSLIKALDQTRLEVSRILFALSKSAKSSDTNSILIVGYDGKLKNLSKELFDRIQKKLVFPQRIPNFDLETSDLQYYAVPIGFALSGIPKIDDQVNFRQNEFAFPNPWKRYWQPVGLFVGLSLLLALCYYLMASSYQSTQETELKQEYAYLLGAMKKTFPELEKDYLTKNPSEREHAPQTIDELSQGQIIDRLNFIETTVKTTPDTFPLLPNTPRVSDLMAWLMSHPSFVAHKDPKTNTLEPVLQIENLNYTVVKRPDLTRPRDRYQVKVDLEFTSPSPKQAREFHDALIAPNDFVDPKNEVKWSVNKNKYRASFFLKDRTVYPSP